MSMESKSFIVSDATTAQSHSSTKSSGMKRNLSSSVFSVEAANTTIQVEVEAKRPKVDGDEERQCIRDRNGHDRDHDNHHDQIHDKGTQLVNESECASATISKTNSHVKLDGHSHAHARKDTNTNTNTNTDSDKTVPTPTDTSTSSTHKSSYDSISSDSLSQHHSKQALSRLNDSSQTTLSLSSQSPFQPHSPSKAIHDTTSKSVPEQSATPKTKIQTADSSPNPTSISGPLNCNANNTTTCSLTTTTTSSTQNETTTSHPSTQSNPIKSTTMLHLRLKYMAELEFMLREFKKLERQLLGARNSAKNNEEAPASRERREKLHSFIIHLEDTMRQINESCTIEEKEKMNATSSTTNETNCAVESTTAQSITNPIYNLHSPLDEQLSTQEKLKENEDTEAEEKRKFAESSKLIKITKEKEAEEIVQKLEEHILANLLPVKVRLAKQLAAQQGAARNPVGMPTTRRGLQPATTADKGKGTTFAAAAEQRRLAQLERQRQQEQQPQSQQQLGENNTTGETHGHSSLHTDAISNSTAIAHITTSQPPQFGKVIQTGGSSLTQKLYGPTMGSNMKWLGFGKSKEDEKNPDPSPSSNATTPNRPVLYAGMTPGSKQIHSGISAASGVHNVVIENSIYSKKLTNTSIEKPSTLPSPPLQTLSVSNNKNKVARPSIEVNVVPTAFTKTTGGKVTTTGAVVDPNSGSNSKVDPTVIAQNNKINEESMKIALDTTSSKTSQSNTTRPSPVTTNNSTDQDQSNAKKDESNNDISAAEKTKMSIFVMPRPTKKSLKDPDLTEEERKEMKQRRHNRKVEKRRVRLLEEERVRQIALIQQQQQQQQQHQQQQQQAAALRRAGNTYTINPKHATSNHKGPRNVEYICSLCNETYTATCEYNPWWALQNIECPKCGKTQIPRLDISASVNAIEYHPALLSHNSDSKSNTTNNNNCSNGGIKPMSLNPLPNSSNLMRSNISTSTQIPHGTNLDTHTAGGLNMNDDSSDSDSSDDSDYGDNMSLCTKAENEDFGKDYLGPKYSDYDMSRLMVMISHAQTCPGKHKNPNVRDVCRSVKFLMLHVRDCPGTTAMRDICPYPWCRKTKHLLYHLVSCVTPKMCKICSPDELSVHLRRLNGLNQHRKQKQLQLQKQKQSQIQKQKQPKQQHVSPVLDMTKANTKASALPEKKGTTSTISGNTAPLKHPGAPAHMVPSPLLFDRPNATTHPLSKMNIPSSTNQTKIGVATPLKTGAVINAYKPTTVTDNKVNELPKFPIKLEEVQVQNPHSQITVNADLERLKGGGKVNSIVPSTNVSKTSNLTTSQPNVSIEIGRKDIRTPVEPGPSDKTVTNEGDVLSRSMAISENEHLKKDSKLNEIQPAAPLQTTSKILQPSETGEDAKQTETKSIELSSSKNAENTSNQLYSKETNIDDGDGTLDFQVVSHDCNISPKLDTAIKEDSVSFQPDNLVSKDAPLDSHELLNLSITPNLD